MRRTMRTVTSRGIVHRTAGSHLTRTIGAACGLTRIDSSPAADKRDDDASDDRSGDKDDTEETSEYEERDGKVTQTGNSGATVDVLNAEGESTGSITSGGDWTATDFIKEPTK